MGGPGGEVEDDGEGVTFVAGGAGNEVAGEFEEEGGFAGAWGAEDEEMAAGVVEDLGDAGVGGQGVGGLVAGVDDLLQAVNDGIGVGFQAEGEAGFGVEGLVQDALDPGGADFVEEGEFVAAVAGEGAGVAVGGVALEVGECGLEVGERGVAFVVFDEVDGAEGFGGVAAAELVPVEAEAVDKLAQVVEAEGLEGGEEGLAVGGGHAGVPNRVAR